MRKLRPKEGRLYARATKQNGPGLTLIDYLITFKLFFFLSFLLHTTHAFYFYNFIHTEMLITGRLEKRQIKVI